MAAQQGVAQFGAQQPVSAALVENRYDFELPSQIDPGQLHGEDRRCLADACGSSRPCGPS